jgi:hypothetical protein
MGRVTSDSGDKSDSRDFAVAGLGPQTRVVEKSEDTGLTAGPA